MLTKVIQVNPIELQNVEDSVRAHLAAFARGDFDTWGESFAPNVFFTAADPEEVFFEREAAVAEMHKDFDFVFDEGLQIDIEPQSFQVGMSSDQRVAWTAARLQYTVRFQGESNSFLLRPTTVLSKKDRRWSIRATQYSIRLPESRVLEALTGGYLPSPTMIGDSRGRGAQSLVEEFIDQLADLSRAAIRQDAHVFGPFPGEHAEGDVEVRALFAQWISHWGVLRLRPDGIRAELTSAESGWVAANVEVSVRYQGQRVALPLRALLVYQKEQDRWAIAQAHLSVGIPDELAE